MELIAAYWWFWLLVCLLSLVYAVRTQLAWMSRRKILAHGEDAEKFFKGMGPIFAAMGVAGVSSILLLIATVINIVTYLQSH